MDRKETPSPVDATPPPASSKEVEPPRPFSIYTRNEKWMIVSLIAFAGLFSPLTANIYFPAIPTLVQEFHKSTELINLTVTMYIIFQGLAPMLWGTLSDQWGRRPIYMACLFVLAMSCVGLALVPTNAYWLLMLLRCFQAAGSASTIAIGAGVIGDISTRAERGGFYGLFTMGPLVGPAIGPVIGGLLAGHLGWRSIFWFLCIAASVCFIILVLFLPETLRLLVGDGSIRPPLIYRPIIPIVGRKVHQQRPDPAEETRKKFQNPLLLLIQIDILNLLCISALACAVFYSVLAPISTLLMETYPFLDETKIGLCFLGIGFGMVIGSSITGRFLDRQYAAIKAQHLKKRRNSGTSETEGGNNDVDLSFPIERARLQWIPIPILLMVGCSAGYGWCIQKGVNLAAPLILQVLVGLLAISAMNPVQTLMIDLVPKQSSSVTACNNLVRCTLSAVIVALVDVIIQAVGTGWTYVIMSGMSLACLPLVFVAIKIGPRCREKRRNATHS
ncbi:MFS general substrate transporter [Pluteus cervinus]|uniref:MFS general substrate transporter n=1 Tax=Pluteus cervinus TaxID=181527 RepID=A0ACD3BHF6_9AGAR|nr:MFS general substrate transporter [Pluteus cervinus]